MLACVAWRCFALLACFACLLALFALLSCVAFARDVVFPRRQCVSLRGNGCMPTSLPRFVFLGYFACLLCLFALIACSVVLHEETQGANMSTRRYRRRSKMKRRGVENASQNALEHRSNMAPRGLEIRSKMAPGGLPGASREANFIYDVFLAYTGVPSPPSTPLIVQRTLTSLACKHALSVIHSTPPNPPSTPL